MSDKYMRGDYLMTHIILLNGRYFNRLLGTIDVDFTGEQGKILAVLRDFGNGLTTTEIAKYSGLAKNTLTTMLRNLEKQDLISQTNHATDKRKRLISLTEKSYKQLALVEEVSQKVGTNFYAGFNQEEIVHFEQQLERILNNVEMAGQQSKEISHE